MKDGGDHRTFNMYFTLTKTGPGTFVLQRTDCEDPAVVLTAIDEDTLQGGGYTINFYE
jgi:hypothetical protein